MEPEEIPEGDTDEDAIEPIVDPQKGRARINHILCKSDILSPEDLEEDAIYEEKDGDWGTGMPPADPRPPMQGEDAEEQTGPSTIAWGSGGPIAPREEPEETTENRRCSYPETEDRGRNPAYQSTEEDTGQ